MFPAQNMDGRRWQLTLTPTSMDGNKTTRKQPPESQEEKEKEEEEEEEEENENQRNTP